MDNLNDFVSDKLQFLQVDNGFKVNHKTIIEGHADGLIELENKELLVQVIRDRGQISIYFANSQSPKELFELSELIEILKGEKHSLQSTDPAAIQFLHENFNEISDLLIKKFPQSISRRNELREETLRSLGYGDEGEE